MTEEPEWLSEDERQAWLTLLGVAVLLPAALDTQLQRDSGLTHFDYLVLAMLSEAPGRTLKMRELAERSNASLSRLSHVVKKLEARGWIRRHPCDGDGRTTLATLTDDGLATIVAAAPGHVRSVRALVLDALEPAEVHQLSAIGAKLMARLDPARRFGAADQDQRQG